jgi:hypothetical protein
MIATEHLDTARARSRHLAIDLSALAAGLFDPSPTVLDALAELGFATALDLELVAA